MPFVHTVAQGDCLSSIAKLYGFQKWQAIFDHPDNADLKKARKNPNVILPGDKITIPDKDPKQAARPTGKSHHFTLISPKTKVRVVLKDGKGQPFANKKYVLTVAGKDIQGQTGGDGLIEQPIDADLADADLSLYLDDKTIYKWTLRLGHLDPVDATSGADARLQNLGFDPGSDDDGREAAIKRFQTKYGLTVNGQLDDATKSKLEGVHDKK